MVPRFFFLFFCLLLLFPIASALIVSPARIDLGNPTEEQELTTVVYNDLEWEIVVEVNEKYPIEEGVFEVNGTNKIIVGPLESKEVRVIYHPLDFEQFGEVQVGLLRFYQVPYSNAQVGATVAVNIPVYAHISYPQKFLSLDVTPLDPAFVGERVPLEAHITHMGTSVIDSVKGSFLVSGESYEKEISIDDILLFLPGRSETVAASLDTIDMEPGMYNVTFVAGYDGEERTSDPVSLLIGSEEIQILSLSPQTLVEGQMNTITTKLFNMWVDDLTGSVAMVLQNDGRSTVITQNIGSFTFPPAVEKEIVTSLDLTSVTPGAYTLLVRVAYDTSDGQKIQEKTFHMTVLEAGKATAAPAEEGISLQTVLLIVSITISVILLVILITLFVKWKHVPAQAPVMERAYRTERGRKKKLRPNKQMRLSKRRLKS